MIETESLRQLYVCFLCAGVAQLVDARELKSLGPQVPCRFESGPPHQPILVFTTALRLVLLITLFQLGAVCSITAVQTVFGNLPKQIPNTAKRQRMAVHPPTAPE